MKLFENQKLNNPEAYNKGLFYLYRDNIRKGSEFFRNCDELFTKCDFEKLHWDLIKFFSIRHNDPDINRFAACIYITYGFDDGVPTMDYWPNSSHIEKRTEVLARINAFLKEDEAIRIVSDGGLLNNVSYNYCWHGKWQYSYAMDLDDFLTDEALDEVAKIRKTRKDEYHDRCSKRQIAASNPDTQLSELLTSGFPGKLIERTFGIKTVGEMFDLIAKDQEHFFRRLAIARTHGHTNNIDEHVKRTKELLLKKFRQWGIEIPSQKVLIREEHPLLDIKIREAVTVAEKYGAVSGEDHKQWIIDQMLRRMLNKEYSKWVSIYNSRIDENGKPYIPWCEGVEIEEENVNEE